MFISSVGGHLTQMLELKKIFNDYAHNVNNFAKRMCNEC